MKLLPKIFFAVLFMSCTHGGNNAKKEYASPKGYDLNNPEKFNMPPVLDEISGIAFSKGNPDTIYAEQDEQGNLFHFKLGDKQMIVSKFGKHGDYEDVSICNNYVIMLKSDGVLYTFPLSEANSNSADKVHEWDNILPPGEYEGLSSNDETGEVFVLCKHCQGDNASKTKNGYIFKLGNDGSIKASGSFGVSITDIEYQAGINKMVFHPSAITQNPFTREWYIVSSVNKILITTDQDWKIKAVYPLDPSLFPQPEGIAFDKDRTMYISNERNTTACGTILKFIYKAGKE